MGMLTWDDVMQNPYLQDLPFKIELNKWGRIEMSPKTNRQGLVQAELAAELGDRPGGNALVECSVQTADGVRVADVAWVSNKLLKQFGDLTPFPSAPETCVEIMSPNNSWPELHAKASLYLEAGGREVWIVTLDGKRTVVTNPDIERTA